MNDLIVTIAGGIIAYSAFKLVTWINNKISGGKKAQ